MEGKVLRKHNWPRWCRCMKTLQAFNGGRSIMRQTTTNTHTYRHPRAPNLSTRPRATRAHPVRAKHHSQATPDQRSALGNNEHHSTSTGTLQGSTGGGGKSSVGRRTPPPPPPSRVRRDKPSWRRRPARCILVIANHDSKHTKSCMLARAGAELSLFPLTLSSVE